jgi:TadE-like protein
MSKKGFFRTHRKQDHSRGQGLVELTLVIPALLILFSGLIEFGFLYNHYLALLTATRNAARFGSDGSYNVTDSNHTCRDTRDYFRQLGCLVSQELRQERPYIAMDDNGTPDDYTDDFMDPTRGDDVIISVFSISQGDPATVDQRFPGSAGWSYALDLQSYGIRNHSSNFTSSDVEAHLDSGAPSTGLLLIEIFYSYEQTLKLPWITAVFPEMIPLHVYTFMPLSSAEPTPTPEP